jgi:hypothetical protein
VVSVCICMRVFLGAVVALLFFLVFSFSLIVMLLIADQLMRVLCSYSNLYKNCDQNTVIQRRSEKATVLRWWGKMKDTRYTKGVVFGRVEVEAKNEELIKK